MMVVQTMSKRRSSKKSTSNQGFLGAIGVIIVALVGLGG